MKDQENEIEENSKNKMNWIPIDKVNLVAGQSYFLLVESVEDYYSEDEKEPRWVDIGSYTKNKFWHGFESTTQRTDYGENPDVYLKPIGDWELDNENMTRGDFEIYQLIYKAKTDRSEILYRMRIIAVQPLYYPSTNFQDLQYD